MGKKRALSDKEFNRVILGQTEPSGEATEAVKLYNAMSHVIKTAFPDEWESLFGKTPDAHWITNDNMESGSCSNCGATYTLFNDYIVGDPYCSKCGAKMNGVEVRNDEK